MPWSAIATGLFNVLLWWLKRDKKNKDPDTVEMTEKQQKLKEAAINAQNKAERSARRKLDNLDSLRQRAETINKYKNSDV